MMLTVFRSRMKSDLKPEQLKELMQMDSRMGALARTIPGYVSHKAFGAQDGERVVIVEFESEQAQLVFARHPEHLEAIKMGKNVLLEYSVQVCSLQREMRPQK
jgi:heme-degrading monooxygenase HmoA